MAQDNDTNSVPRYALVIGNSSYVGVSSLKNPVNDATDIGAALEELDFEVTLQLDLDLKGMKTQIGEFSKKLNTDGSIGLIYYAGHGVEVGGRNYLLPIGVSVDTAADLEYESIDVQRIIDNMKRARKGMNIIMIDACRNNPFRGFRSIGGTRGIAQMAAPLGTYISSATASGDVAADGHERNSPYTKALLNNIATPGISLEQLFKKVRIEVLSDTGELQVPWEASSLTSEFYFVGNENTQDVKDSATNEADPDSVAGQELESAEGVHEEDTMQAKEPDWEDSAEADNEWEEAVQILEEREQAIKEREQELMQRERELKDKKRDDRISGLMERLETQKQQLEDANRDRDRLKENAKRRENKKTKYLPEKAELLNGTYTIQQMSNDRFLDAHEDVRDSSVVTRNRQNNATQQWIFSFISKNVYSIQQKSSRRYMDAHEGENDNSVVTRRRQNNTKQEWIVLPLGNNVYTIQQRSNRLFMDAHEGSNDNSVVTRNRQQNNTQRWRINKK